MVISFLWEGSIGDLIPIPYIPAHKAVPSWYGSARLSLLSAHVFSLLTTVDRCLPSVYKEWMILEVTAIYTHRFITTIFILWAKMSVKFGQFVDIQE